MQPDFTQSRRLGSRITLSSYSNIDINALAVDGSYIYLIDNDHEQLARLTLAGTFVDFVVDPLADGDWQGLAVSGSLLYALDNVNVATERDSGRDISLGYGYNGEAVFRTALRYGLLWTVHLTQRGHTQRRHGQGMPVRTISLGSGSWNGAVSDGTTLWFVDNTSNRARAYVAATQARDSGRDISLGTVSWLGGVSDGTTLWFVNDTSNTARAYVAATQARDSWQGHIAWYGQLARWCLGRYYPLVC